MKDIFGICHKFSNRKLLVDVLAILFGISAWICVNGMFMQLPLLVQSQPEGWNLPSYLSVIIQIANVGPILYSVSQKLFPKRVKDSWIICMILILGTTAVLMMALFYYKTSLVSGSEHSTALFILTFFIALVGCTSSVLFMPFMGNFLEIYLISYFIGEGLSGFFPSIVALIQGVGGNPVCLAESENSTATVPYTEPPRFSTEGFFFFVFAMMTVSTIAFILLNNLKYCQSERTDTQTRSSAFGMNNSKMTEGYSNNRAPVHSPVFTIGEDVGALMVHPETDNLHHKSPATNENSDRRESADVNSGVAVTVLSQPSTDKKLSSLTRPVHIYYLVLTGWVCMFSNGIFPSIQSYSCLPYGNVAYHLSVTLGSMANPLACFLAFFYPYSSVKVMSLLTSSSLVFTGYILTMALLSPAPPLVTSEGGEFLVVSYM
jgi:riboflavin transporter 2